MSSSTDGSCGGWITRETDGFLGLDRDVLALRLLGAGGSMAVLDSEKGTTPARRAISCSPSCQCMASAALQGIAISSATLDHISALNLRLSDVSLLPAHTLFYSSLPISRFFFFFFFPSQALFWYALTVRKEKEEGGKKAYLSYNLASLFFLSSSHSLLRSR